MRGPISDLSSVDRPWRKVSVPAVHEGDRSSVDDALYARSIGLPSKHAWAQYLKDTEFYFDEVGLSKWDIGGGGGYPDDFEWEELPDAASASVWPVEHPTDIQSVLADLARIGKLHSEATNLKAVLGSCIANPGTIALAARQTCSRRASSLLVVHREVTVCDGEVSYDLFPRYCFGDAERRDTPISALMACFQFQAVADLETIMLSMAKANDMRRVSIFCHNDDERLEAVAEEMQELVGYAYENSFADENLPGVFDFEKLQFRAM